MLCRLYARLLYVITVLFPSLSKLCKVSIIIPVLFPLRLHNPNLIHERNFALLKNKIIPTFSFAPSPAMLPFH
jgi:hypothetical protein